MPNVNLPNNIINRFSGKIMAIVGYESDMVFSNGDRVPITGHITITIVLI